MHELDEVKLNGPLLAARVKIHDVTCLTFLLR